MATQKVPLRPMITITQEDINNAIRADSSHCMISDALAKAYPAARCIKTDIRTIRFTDKHTGERRTHLTPAPAAVHIVQWDSGIDPSPFTLQLAPPIQVRPSGVRGNQQRAITGVRNNGAPGHEYAPTVVGGTPLPLGPMAAGPTRTLRGRGPAEANNKRQFGVRGFRHGTGVPA